MRVDSKTGLPSALSYGMAYVWWFVLIAASTLAAMAARDLYQMAMVLTPWNRYVVHVVNQVLTLTLILTLLAVVIVLEAYLRNGAARGVLVERIWRVAGHILATLAVIQGLRLLIEIAVGSVNLISVLLFVLAAAGAWGCRRQALQLAGVRLTSVSLAVDGRLTRLGWAALALLLAGGALLLFLPIKYPLNPYDEGLALVNGLRVLAGDAPLRDYWAIYPPGQSYVLAGLFALAGPTVMVARVYDTLVRVGIVVVILLLALRLLPRRRWALLPYLSAVVLLAAATFYGYAVFPALLFAFAGLLLWFHALDHAGDDGRARLAWLFAAGLAVGLCALFRVDIGVYSSAALAVGMAISGLWVEGAGRRVGQRVGRLLRELAVAAIGALLVALPFYGLLATVGGFAALWAQLVVFPATTFHAVRHLPYPPLWPDWSEWSQVGDWLRFYLPMVVLTSTALTVLAALLRGGDRLRRGHAQAAALAVLGAGLFVQALSRYDGIHVLPASLCVILLLLWLLQQIPAARWRRPFVALPLGLVLLLPIWFYLLEPYGQLSEHVAAFAPTGCYAEAPAASCVPLFSGQETMVRLLGQLDPDGGALFSGLLHHDQIFVNDVSLYFLARRPIPTRYHELHPGVATTLPVQEEIAAELERGAVPWLVLVDWPNPREANDSALSSGVTVLDEYIRAHYRRQRTEGWYQLWQRTE